VLLVGAGLMIRTLYFLKGASAGIDPRNVLTLPLSISSQKYTTATQQNGFFQHVLEQVRVLPGVESAGVVDSLPEQGGSTQPVQVEGQPVMPMADQPEVAVRLISPGYLQAMRIPLKLGRDIAESDNADRKPVALVSESFAKRFWPNGNPIGKQVKLTFFEKQGACEVVGVVGDVKLNGLGATAPVQAVYHAMAQSPETTGMMLAMRASLPPTSLTTAVTGAIHRIDADEPVARVETMEQVMDESISQNRLNMILLSSFAGLALLLASIGIYGVQAYAVRQRTREFGIRVAMGARPAEVFRLILAQGLRLTVVGLVVGLAASFGLTRLVATQLYGLSPTDPLTFAGVSVALVLVMLAACVVPAARATRIDPVVALRDE
jgi:putative ABC transport system permease protein